MSRQCHILKRNYSSEYPSEAVWFDTETDPENIDDHSSRQILRFGWAAFRRRHRPGHWTASAWHRFTTPAEFWDFVFSRLRGKQRLYLFCHSAAFDAPVVDSFRILQADRWKLRLAVLESPPVMLKWVKPPHTIYLLDTLNWWRMPLKALGESLGMPKLDMPSRDASEAEWDVYCRRDVEVIMDACLKWWQFLQDRDMGGFAPTLAGQAIRTYRHRFMNTPILIDTNTKAQALSRKALHGGRTECFRLGEIAGPVYHFDVNSQYPAVMYSQPMPCKLLVHVSTPTMEELRQWAFKYAVVADVEIETDDPVYGAVIDGTLLFPVGRFRTVLTTPEVCYAFSQNHLRSVSECAVYQRAILFREYVAYFYALRQHAKEHGDTVLALQAKTLLNSLYGKFGQKGRVYETVAETESQEIKTWYEVDATTGRVFSMRQFAGVVQQLRNEPESMYSFPAIAAHVTAYARLHLWTLLHYLDRENIYYTDTDSLWCNRTGADRLSSRIHQTRLGALKQEGCYPSMIIYGPKDYEVDGKRTTKGVKRQAQWLDANTVEQQHFSTLKGLLHAGDLSAPIITTRVKHLRREYLKGRVLPDGRVLPPILP